MKILWSAELIFLGELQIGGGSLAKGYINDEELTMKKVYYGCKRGTLV